jgi:hypothetical protein
MDHHEHPYEACSPKVATAQIDSWVEVCNEINQDDDCFARLYMCDPILPLGKPTFGGGGSDEKCAASNLQKLSLNSNSAACTVFDA